MRQFRLLVLVALVMASLLVVISFVMSTNVPEDDSSAPVMLRPNLANLEQDSHQVNRKKKKVVAIGVKTSGETMHSFVPIQLLTFLKGREELLFLGGDDYDGDDGGPVVGKWPVHDVFTGAYDQALNRIQKKKELADEVYDGGKRGTKRGRKPGKVTDGFDDTTNLRRRKRSSLDSATTGASKDDESLIPDKVEVQPHHPEPKLPQPAKTKQDLDPHKNLPGLKLLAEKFPHADWFLIVSDKSYVLMENLERLLEDLDPEEPHYIGKQSVNYKGCSVEEFGNGPTMATDAGGILLSKGAIKPVLEIMDSCIVTYNSCWSGDIRVALCLRDAGIRIGLPQEGFTGDSPTNPDFVYGSDPCIRPITFTNLTLNEMEQFSELQQERERLSRQTHHQQHDETIKPLITLGSIYKFFHSSQPSIQQDMDRIGGEYKHLPKNSSITPQECQEACVRDSKEPCTAWVLDNTKKCILKRGGPQIAKSRDGFFSGVLMDRFQCFSG